MFGFGRSPNAVIDIRVDKVKKQSFTIKEKKEGDQVVTRKIPLFIKDQKVTGKIDIKLDNQKRLSHSGIKVELIGKIDIKSENALGSNFMCNGFDLEPSGTLYSDKTYDFNFDVFQKPYDSYYGKSVQLRYIIKVTIMQSGFGSKNIEKEIDLGVLTQKNFPEDQESPIVMEVGIDDLLNIKISIPTRNYWLDSVL